MRRNNVVGMICASAGLFSVLLDVSAFFDSCFHDRVIGFSN